jgi:prolyl oligopeptidase
MFPRYSAGVGREWLLRGGLYVLANIRGGGEFGPAWHQAALKGQRQKAFDDFAAIAADVVQRGYTQAKHLGCMGGSNGGLLVSTVAMQRPELFGAVVCQVPLTDMRRFHKLLAGASWMGEYGNPEIPAEWEALAKYSPYQNVKKDGKYPRILFDTSTRDDRVHPGHARKLFAKMKDQGHDVLYYENTEGGHAGSANNEQRARITALEFTFLLHALR